jgi:hypothetical protein
METKENFFEFVSPPTYPDNGKAQEFIDKYWNQIPEKDQRFIKVWYRVVISRNPNSYKDLILFYPTA